MERQQVFFILEKYIKAELVNITSFLETNFTNNKETRSIKEEIEDVFNDEYLTLECNDNKKLHYLLDFQFKSSISTKEMSNIKSKNLVCEEWEFQTANYKSFPETM